MDKIRNLLKKTFSYVGGLAVTRPVTFAVICAGTLTAFILTFYWTDAIKTDRGAEGSPETLLTQLLIFFSIYCLSAFCIESSPLMTKGPKVILIPVHIAGALVSFALGSLMYIQEKEKAGTVLFNDLWKKISETVYNGRIISWTMGFCIIMLSLGLFFSFLKMKNPSFAAFLSGNYSKLFFANITFFVLLAGFATLTGIFTALLWGDFGEIYAAVFALVFGGYYIMRSVACFTEETAEPNVFVSVLIRYVLLIMSLAAFVIIYIYMIKITVLREFPSNAVFEILTSLFVSSMPVAYMAAGLLREDGASLKADYDSSSDEAVSAEESVGTAEAAAEDASAAVGEASSEENVTEAEAAKDSLAAVAVGASSQEKNAPKMLYRLAAYLPFIFIPFIFLQIYTAGARVSQYGLTPKRYLGFAMIAFEIVYIVIYFIFYKKKERRISLVLPVIAVFALLCAWVPGINALDLSKSVQLSFIRSYLLSPDEGSESNTDKSRRAAAAYEYITDLDDALAKNMFSAEETEKLKLLVNKGDDDDYYLRTASLIWYEDDDRMDIDISGYDRIRYGCLAAYGKQSADITKTGLYLNEGQELGSYPSASDIEKEYKCTLRTDLSKFKDDHILYGSVSHGKIPNDAGFEEAMDADNLIRLDNGGAFYITQADIDYDSETGEIQSLMLKGYYLSE